LPSNETICTTTSNDFDKFNTYFNYLVVGNLLPQTIACTFGILAHRNIQQISYRTAPLVRRELDKQLSAMVLVQICYMCVILASQFVIYMIAVYGNIKDSIIQAQINLVYVVSLCLYYSHFAFPFYIYMIVSERFRRQFKYVAFKMHMGRWQADRVGPDIPTDSI
ncbi:unnamed protein product, partial [Adineta ricciae]